MSDVFKREIYSCIYCLWCYHFVLWRHVSHGYVNIHCWPLVRNVLWYGRKLKCAAKLMHFTYAVECQTCFYFGRENDYLVWFKYTGFRILIDPFTANPEYWIMCVRYIFSRSASSPHRDYIMTDPILPNMIDAKFPLISTIIILRVLNLLYPIQPETLGVIHWNPYVVLNVTSKNELTYPSYTN